MSYVAARTTGTEGVPVVFTFHGTGGDEHQFHCIVPDLVPGAHVVSPRSDVDEAGMNRFFRRTGEGVYDMYDLWTRAERTGASRAIGLGYSNGANILAAVALIRPEIVEDLILMHPLIPWFPDPQPGLEARRILITAGRRDPICPAPLTEALSDYLEGQGADVTLHWQEGGHEIRNSEIAAVQAFLAS